MHQRHAAIAFQRRPYLRDGSTSFCSLGMCAFPVEVCFLPANARLICFFNERARRVVFSQWTSAELAGVPSCAEEWALPKNMHADGTRPLCALAATRTCHQPAHRVDWWARPAPTLSHWTFYRPSSGLLFAHVSSHDPDGAWRGARTINWGDGSQRPDSYLRPACHLE